MIQKILSYCFVSVFVMLMTTIITLPLAIGQAMVYGHITIASNATQPTLPIIWGVFHFFWVIAIIGITTAVGRHLARRYPELIEAIAL